MWLQLNGEVRSDMEPPGSEEADASLSDLTVLGCVQGEAELPAPPGSPATLPRHVFPVAYIPKSVAAESTFSICLC